MVAAGLVESTEGYHSRADLEELRGEVLRPAIAGILALALVLVCYVLFASDRPWLQVIATMFLLGTVAWAANDLQARGTAPASAALIAGLCLTITCALYLFPGSLAPAWFALAIALGAVLLGARTGFLVAAFATSVLIVVAEDPRALFAEGDLPGALLLVWASAVISWLASCPLQTALDWTWTSYAQALETTEQLRDRQGELTRTLKSLNEAYYRLEVANQELARARSAAEEARRLKAEFAANISHELRTPLNLIIGFSEILMASAHSTGGPSLPAALRADVDVIHRNARHLSNLIDDVLDLSQVDAGRMGLSKERVSLQTVVAEAVAAVSGLFEARGLSLSADLLADLPTVYADRTRVRQVLINLLNNAARFTAQGGATISARCENGSLVVAVADTGVGIAPEHIPEIFEEFRQLDGSTRRSHDGSGLGLAISKRFVELHGGAMWAESAPGEGSTFHFTLPLIENVVGSTLRPEWDTWVRLPVPADEPQKSVLVIAEDPAVAGLFRRYLDGYQVVPAGADEEALHVFTQAQTPIHGVVATTSPNADLTERLRRLREVPAGVPLIACSLPTRRDAGERLGVADYLVKPISRERLLEALTRLGKHVRTVLVVDDDPEMVRLLGRMIRSGSKRYRVLRAYGGAEALALLRGKRPDAVILDLVMPEVDGYAVLEEMRAREELRDIPVVVLTARSYEKETVAAGAVGITREGGLSVGELMACLKAALEALTPQPGNAEAQRATPA